MNAPVTQQTAQGLAAPVVGGPGRPQELEALRPWLKNRVLVLGRRLRARDWGLIIRTATGLSTAAVSLYLWWDSEQRGFGDIFWSGLWSLATITSSSPAFVWWRFAGRTDTFILCSIFFGMSFLGKVLEGSGPMIDGLATTLPLGIIAGSFTASLWLSK